MSSARSTASKDAVRSVAGGSARFGTTRRIVATARASRRWSQSSCAYFNGYWQLSICRSVVKDDLVGTRRKGRRDLVVDWMLVIGQIPFAFSRCLAFGYISVICYQDGAVRCCTRANTSCWGGSRGWRCCWRRCLLRSNLSSIAR